MAGPFFRSRPARTGARLKRYRAPVVSYFDRNFLTAPILPVYAAPTVDVARVCPLPTTEPLCPSSITAHYFGPSRPLFSPFWLIVFRSFRSGRSLRPRS